MKPSWHPLLVILVSLLVSLSAAGEVWYVPGAAESTGLAGARFSSTLVVANLSSAGVTASIGFIPYDGSPTPEPVERPLAAGQTLQIPAVLDTLFGLTADAGTLTVSAPATLAISLVTANVADPTGTYGVSVAPLMEDSLIGAGQTGHAVWATENADYRTNLALVFADPGTSVEVTALDNEGKSRGTVPVTSERRSSWQARLPDLFPGLDLSAGRVEVKVIRGRVAGYTATVDNSTNDGIAASLVRAPAGASDLLLNGAANSPGRNGTYFVTDARACSPQILWSPDNARFLLNPGRNAYIFYLAGGTPLPLPAHGAGAVYAWAPDGSKVAFYDGQGTVWLVSAGGTGVRNVAEATSGPAWSGDGKLLTFVGPDKTGSALRTFDVAHNSARTLVQAAGDVLQNPQWVPGTSDSLVFSRQARSGDSTIWTVSTSGGANARQIATGSHASVFLRPRH